MSEHILKSLEDLASFSEAFVRKFPEGVVLALSGELGVGKTTFVRTVIEKLASQEKKSPPKVVSPSFVLHQCYLELERPIDHFDLYRIDEVTREGLLEIGYYEAWQRAKDRKGFLFVEWPEKVRDRKDLQIDHHLQIEFGANRCERALRWLR